MGDVVTALARAVQEEGHEVEVILPKYDIINYAEVGIPRPANPITHASQVYCASPLQESGK